MIGYEADKLKPSQIPRPKTGVSSPALKHNEKKTDNNYFVSDTQHIQRLQVPNIPGIFYVTLIFGKNIPYSFSVKIFCL